MQKSRNYDELQWVWQQWREQSGKKMREEYSRFVELSNQAARMNSNFYSKLKYFATFDTNHPQISATRQLCGCTPTRRNIFELKLSDCGSP